MKVDDDGSQQTPPELSSGQNDSTYQSSSMEVDVDGSREELRKPSSGQNDSTGEAKYARSQGCPSDTNVPGGVENLNRALRSVVTDRAFFETFVGFNKTTAVDGRETGFLNKLFTKEEIESLDFWSNPKTSGLLSVPATHSKDETKITNMMVNVLSVFFEKEALDIDREEEIPGGMKVLAEARLESLEEGKPRSVPRLDITVGSNDRLLAFVEVGLISKATNVATMSMSIDTLFWKKVHQVMNYLERLNKGVESARKDKIDRIFKVNGNFLFSVIVFEKADHSIARMAIFCAQPKNEDASDFRVAMMWRKEFVDLKKLDDAYTAFVRAILHLEKRNTSKDSEWRYLGPDCAQVTTIDGKTHVLRAYDNRVRSTPRSPNVYKNFSGLECQQVIKVEDSGEYGLLGFGELLGSSADSLLSMLFFDDTVSKKGQIEVIAVPFLEGSHELNSIEQALAVVTFLEKLHDDGYVHGDIRGFNLVFSKEEIASRPIDFDFGGKEKDTEVNGKEKDTEVNGREKDYLQYPPGYNPAPGDGNRPGIEGKPITKEDDVKSLISVLFACHATEPSPREINGMACDCTERNSDERNIIDNAFSIYDNTSEVHEYKTMEQVRTALTNLSTAVDTLKECMKKRKQEGHDFSFKFVASKGFGYYKQIQDYEGPKFGRTTKPKKDMDTQGSMIEVRKTRKQGTPWGAQKTPLAKVNSPGKSRRNKMQKTETTSAFGRRRSDVENQVQARGK